MTVQKFHEKANKWHIKTLESGETYEVPRIYLMFIVEKPSEFAQLIHSAVQLRSECESKLKFDAVVDGIILSEFPKPPQRHLERIRSLLCHRFNKWIGVFEDEHIVVYQKTLAAMELLRFYEQEPHSVPSSIQLPTIEPKRKLKIPVKKSNRVEFETARRDLQRLWLCCSPEAIRIMEFINNACENVTRTSLFHIESNDICSLMGFVESNYKKLSEMSSFLKEKWIEEVVVKAVRFQLRHVRKGWFDLNLSEWGIYRMSKLYRLIELIKHRMEIAVRLMLRSSLQAFVNHLCQPCESMSNVAPDFVWGDDLVESWFPYQRPVFAIKLSFVGGDPIYSTAPEEFEAKIIKIFKSRILTTHEIPHIDPLLLPKLKFDKSLRLSSLGLLDDEIQNQISIIQHSYQVCIIPLKAYANEYLKFVDFKRMNNAEFILGMQDNDVKAKDMRELIATQVKSIEEIELTVPSTIVIGAFQIDMKSLKKDLLVKRRDLYERLLTMYTGKVKVKLEAINKAYEEIFDKLTLKCENIEELLLIREWIPQISEDVDKIESKMRKMTGDFDVVEAFHVVLSDETFALKVLAKSMPKNIQDAITETELKLAADFELFRKLQAFQETQLVDKIEAIASSVDVFTSKHNFDDLLTTTKGIDDLWNMLNEMLTLGELLNSRQEVFGQPNSESEIDTQQLIVFVGRLRPHHILWTMASGFISSKDDWTSSPLSSVDITVIEAEVKRCESVLQDSRIHFTSRAEMMSLIEKVATEVEGFIKIFDVMKDLSNDGFEEDHWVLLSERTGITINPEQTFDSLLAHGILKHAEIVKQVSEEATREVEARILELEMERQRLEAEEVMKQKKALRPVRNDI